MNLNNKEPYKPEYKIQALKELANNIVTLDITVDEINSVPAFIKEYINTEALNNLNNSVNTMVKQLKNTVIAILLDI